MCKSKQKNIVNFYYEILENYFINMWNLEEEKKFLILLGGRSAHRGYQSMGIYIVMRVLVNRSLISYYLKS